jgi:hypothetical protein
VLEISWHVRKSFYSYVLKLFFEKRANFKLQTLASCARQVREVRRMYKPSTDFIQFLLSDHSVFQSCTSNDEICSRL